MRQSNDRRASGASAARDHAVAPSRASRARSSTSSAARREASGGDATGQSRASLYDEVTNRIVAELEAGRFPWVQPWGRASASGAAGAAVGLPRNAVTGRAYAGINVLILWGALIEQAYPSQGWLTFRQCRDAGGCVRKGERGTTIVYADRFTPEAEKARAADTGDAARAIPFLKRFTVFNRAQCDGLPASLVPDPVPLSARQVVPVGEELIAASGIDMRIGGDKAYYVPSLDFVQLPPQPAFFHPIDFYRTAFHELCHASGHGSRLARKLDNEFGSKDYGHEELIAELGSAFLCARLGIVPTVRHADYLGCWLDTLRADSRAIFRAASAAGKAADWLLARRDAASSPRQLAPDPDCDGKDG
jgi:antirestriction protein ArdC